MGMREPGQSRQTAAPVRAKPPVPHTATNSTIKIRGLPYRAVPDEILAFFNGYEYLPDSLQIGLDSLGRPSGEAWLAFVSPEEAA
eukprot:gene6367-2996_t